MLKNAEIRSEGFSLRGRLLLQAEIFGKQLKLDLPLTVTESTLFAMGQKSAGAFVFFQNISSPLLALPPRESFWGEKIATLRWQTPSEASCLEVVSGDTRQEPLRFSLAGLQGREARVMVAGQEAALATTVQEGAKINVVLGRVGVLNANFTVVR